MTNRSNIGQLIGKGVFLWEKPVELQKVIEQPHNVFMGIHEPVACKYPAPWSVLNQHAPKPIGHGVWKCPVVEKNEKMAWFTVERLFFSVERLFFDVVPPWSPRGSLAGFPINPNLDFVKVCKKMLQGRPLNRKNNNQFHMVDKHDCKSAFANSLLFRHKNGAQSPCVTCSPSLS